MMLVMVQFNFIPNLLSQANQQIVVLLLFYCMGFFSLFAPAMGNKRCKNSNSPKHKHTQHTQHNTQHKHTHTHTHTFTGFLFFLTFSYIFCLSSYFLFLFIIYLVFLLFFCSFFLFIFSLFLHFSSFSKINTHKHTTQAYMHTHFPP